MSAIGRVIVILFAFFVASLVAGFVVVLAVLLPEWSDLTIGPIEPGVIGIALTFGFIFLSGTALIPALLVVAAAEILSIRSLLFYTAMGALTGLIIYASLGRFDSETWTLSGLSRRELEIMAAAGIAAGFAYWMIAGRNAGRWRESLSGSRMS